MKQLLLLSATVLIVLSCSSCTIRTSDIRSSLKAAEEIVNIAPDSALTIISAIDRSRIKGRELKARVALIHSMVLDKNGIDIKSDSIISPALSFFSKHGRQEERCKTFYYTARIFENANELDSAMEWLIKAEKAGVESSDTYSISLILSTKGRIYNKLHEFSEAAENYSEAAEYMLKAGDPNRFAANKMREANCLLMAREYSEARNMLKTVEKYKDSLSIGNLAKYYPLLINICEKTGIDSTQCIMTEYLSRINDEKIIDWLTVSQVLIKNGKTSEAIDALNNHRKYRKENAAYFYRLAQAHEANGHDTEALKALKEYILLSGIIGDKIINQDTRFVEERQHHISQHEKAEERATILLLSIAVALLGFLLSSLSIIAIRKQLQIKRSEHLILQAQLDGLLQEREELARMHIENEEGRRIISERLRIIDNFVFSEALNDSIFEKKASETLKKITEDRETFIKQNRLIFNQSHPAFIEFLKARGLNETEIEHCCLYAVGLNGKMVTSFTNLKRHYHIGSDIRKKLGLNEHDTNISIYIKRLLKEYE